MSLQLSSNFNTVSKEPANVPSKGHFLVHFPTGRVYPYAEGAAKRQDMEEYIDGLRVHNRLAGQNKRAPQDDGIADIDMTGMSEVKERMDAQDARITRIEDGIQAILNKINN